jgi:hypothetical protein
MIYTVRNYIDLSKIIDVSYVLIITVLQTLTCQEPSIVFIDNFAMQSHGYVNVCISLK